VDHFDYLGGQLCAEDVNLEDLAREVGTPCYVYSRATLERHWHAFDSALSEVRHLVCYSVKANSNLGVLNLFARLGSGFDIVSVGELERVILAGGDPAKTIYSGVAKKEHEISRALEAGIRCINVESSAELHRVNKVASNLNCVAPVSIRVNPDVDAKTHPYIATGLNQAKFGIQIDEALETYQLIESMEHVHTHGIACHIGSQITEVGPFVNALDRLLALLGRLAADNIHIDELDLGGGLGIRYQNEQPPSPDEYAAAIIETLNQHEQDIQINIEPGRAIMGNAGVLLSKVEYLKHNREKNFAIIDAGMNDFLRPALYQAWHEILPTQTSEPRTAAIYDVVGPICETGDVLGADRELSIAAQDVLAIRSAGAYGAVMSSNYNTRPRPAEVIVDKDNWYVTRQLETIDTMVAGESQLPD
jgi:diaminopimelate decarboxylase